MFGHPSPDSGERRHELRSPRLDMKMLLSADECALISGIYISDLTYRFGCIAIRFLEYRNLTYPNELLDTGEGE